MSVVARRLARLLLARAWPLWALAAPHVAMAATAATAAGGHDCIIEPSQTVELRSAVEGVIDKVLVRRGDRVRAGQALVLLESSAEASALEVARFKAQMEGRITTARNRLDFANTKLARQKELHAQNFVTAQVRDEAEAEQRVATSELREAQEAQTLAQRELKHATDQLARRTLRSPFDGVVVDRFLNPGDLAEYGTGRRPVLKLAQVEPLRVEVVLPVALWGLVKAGTVAVVTPETIGGRFPAAVVVADSVFDTASGTFGARLAVTSQPGQLPAGIRCKLEFPGLAAARPVAKP